MKNIFIGIGVLLLGGTLLVGGTIAAKIILAPLAVVEKTLDADNMIGNYEYFKRQYAEIQAFDSKVQFAKKAYEMAAEMASDHFESRQEINRLRSVLLGLESQRRDMIAQYNARTQMANRDLFRTGDLPDYIAE